MFGGDGGDAVRGSRVRKDVDGIVSRRRCVQANTTVVATVLVVNALTDVQHRQRTLDARGTLEVIAEDADVLESQVDVNAPEQALSQVGR